jgi:hypothetical protein
MALISIAESIRRPRVARRSTLTNKKRDAAGSSACTAIKLSSSKRAGTPSTPICLRRAWLSATSSTSFCPLRGELKKGKFTHVKYRLFLEKPG